MSGRVGDLSPKQESTLKQFKENVKDIMKLEWDDHYFLRWLRARNFDLKKSEKMFRENLKWRKQFNTDRMLEWEAPEVVRMYYPGGVCGVDKEGYPILIDCLGFMDLKGMMYSANPKDILRFNVKVFEELEKKTFLQNTKKYGRRIDQYVLIFDMDEIGLKHLWKPVLDSFTDIISVFEANYPEIMKACYVINAPEVFPILWNAVKPFLQEETKRKIKVLGKDYQEELLKNIDPDQLPIHWGGTATDENGDEYCKSKVCIGGKIPEKYRLKNIRENIDMSNFENCTVQRGSSVQLPYEVTEPGSSIRWQFLTEEDDIGFGIFRRTANERQRKGDMDEVLKTERVDSHVALEEGSFVFDTPGTYVFRFDNTLGWVSQRKVSYLIEILAPDKENSLLCNNT